jgi:hypothetical protein
VGSVAVRAGAATTPSVVEGSSGWAVPGLRSKAAKAEPMTRGTVTASRRRREVDGGFRPTATGLGRRKRLRLFVRERRGERALRRRVGTGRRFGRDVGSVGGIVKQRGEPGARRRLWIAQFSSAAERLLDATHVPAPRVGADGATCAPQKHDAQAVRAA